MKVFLHEVRRDTSDTYGPCLHKRFDCPNRDKTVDQLKPVDSILDLVIMCVYVSTGDTDRKV